MSYHRVVPRDLFNEASLLKCVGRLVLKIEDGEIPWLHYHHDGDPFNIRQNEDDGSISVTNVEFFACNRTLGHFRPLNSRDSFPLYLTYGDDELLVFDDAGNVIVTESEARSMCHDR